MQPFTTDLINSNRAIFRYDLVWNKKICTNFVNAKKMPLRQHEIILVFYQKNKYNPQPYKDRTTKERFGRINREGIACYGNIIRAGDCVEIGYTRTIMEYRGIINLDKEERIHPSQKPIKLIQELIKMYSNEFDIILDCFAGSGTTGIACLELNRNYILIEKEKKYVDLINERIDRYNQQLKLF